MDKELEANISLSHYRIVKQIGAGGMGEIYLGEDFRLRRKVALKILPENISGDKERLRRFEQEAFAASALNHPNILTIYEFGEESGTHFLATEYVEGETLREKLNGDELSLADALNIAEQIAFALSAAHAAGIIHRDLKPENIMIRGDGIVKILGFGLAKLIEKKEANPDAEAETRALVKTNPGVVMGTVAYMSPEQARVKDTDERTDIWSLGVLLYEMATRHLPFEGETMNDTIAAILTQEPPLLSRFVADVPPELQRIVGKILRKNRDERYQHIKDLWIDLKDFRQESEFAAKLERSSAPDKSIGGKIKKDAETQILTVSKPTDAETAAVSIKDSAGSNTHATSNAEPFDSSVKRHKTGAVIALAILVIALAGIGYGVYRLTAKQDTPAIVSFQSAKLTRLTSTGKVIGISISPDGKQMAFFRTSLVENAREDALIIASSDGAGERTLAIKRDNERFHRGAFSSLSWLPDGKQIACAYQENLGTPVKLAVLSSEGGAPLKTFEAALDPDTNLSWTRDGREIVYSTTEKGVSNLVAQPVDGGKPRQITNFKSDRIFWLDFSHDGKQLALSRGLTTGDVVLIKDFR